MKRIFSAALALILIAATALAATATLKLTSSQKLETQFAAFRDYLEKLPETDRQAWLAELETLVQQEAGGLIGLSTFYDASSQLADSEPMVWIPKSGSKYHSSPTCSNMKNPQEVTLSQAISRGYDPCKRCKP